MCVRAKWWQCKEVPLSLKLGGCVLQLCLSSATSPRPLPSPSGSSPVRSNRRMASTKREPPSTTHARSTHLTWQPTSSWGRARNTKFSLVFSSSSMPTGRKVSRQKFLTQLHPLLSFILSFFPTFFLYSWLVPKLMWNLPVDGVGTKIPLPKSMVAGTFTELSTTGNLPSVTLILEAETNNFPSIKRSNEQGRRARVNFWPLRGEEAGLLWRLQCSPTQAGRCTMLFMRSGVTSVANTKHSSSGRSTQRWPWSRTNFSSRTLRVASIKRKY